jgi:hypothetical protein
VDFKNIFSFPDAELFQMSSGFQTIFPISWCYTHFYVEWFSTRQSCFLMLSKLNTHFSYFMWSGLKHVFFPDTERTVFQMSSGFKPFLDFPGAEYT